MNIYILLILIGLVSSNKYSNEKVLRCRVESKKAANHLKGMDIWTFDTKTKQITIRVINAQQESYAKTNGKCTVLISDLSKLEEPISTTTSRSETLVRKQDFFQQYRSYNEMKNSLQSWASKTAIATFIPTIGKTVERRDIFAFKITAPTIPGNRKYKRGLWFNSGLHAREWIGPTATLYIIRSILDNAKNPQIKRLLESFEFHFTPLANPDGYEFTRTPGNRLWRKNRRQNPDGSMGVDLNRNWDEHWGLVGGSNDTSSEIYQGPEPQSEPEVQALVNYALRIPNRYAGIDFHSYGQYILHNWGWTTRLSQNENLLFPIGEAIRNAFKSRGFDYTSQTSADLYPASGALDDWMGSKAQMVSFTIELCPNPSSINGFQLPASKIIGCADGAFAAVIAYAEHLKNSPLIPINLPIA